MTPLVGRVLTEPGDRYQVIRVSTGVDRDEVAIVISDGTGQNRSFSIRATFAIWPYEVSQRILEVAEEALRVRYEEEGMEL